MEEIRDEIFPKVEAWRRKAHAESARRQWRGRILRALVYGALFAGVFVVVERARGFETALISIGGGVASALAIIGGVRRSSW